MVNPAGVPMKDEAIVPKVYCNPGGPLAFHKQKVMVKITAPEMKGKTADLDIVAVMDISGSMMGPRLELMKKAMFRLIDKLETTDQLAIVAFNSDIDSRSKLSLSAKPKVELNGLVKSLTAGGNTNIRKALEKAIKILKDREGTKYEPDRRAACIFLMSDGVQNEGGDARKVYRLSEFCVHTFGFGTDHDELVLSEIAYRSQSGVYSNAPNDKLNDFELFMHAQLSLYRSITALEVKVTLTPKIPALKEPTKSDAKVEVKEQEVGAISVDAGDYVVTDGYTLRDFTDSKQVMVANGSRVIRFGDLARDEIRRIIVDIPLHGISVPIVKPDQVLKVDCSYRVPHQTTRPLSVTVEVTFVRDENTDQYQMLADVNRELVRRAQAEFLRKVKGWTDKGGNFMHFAKGQVETAKNALADHFDRTEDTKLMDELYEELGNLAFLLVPNGNDNEYKKLCRAYLLACLSSHGRQRFAGRGGKEAGSPFYLTERMKKYIKEVQKLP